MCARLFPPIKKTHVNWSCIIKNQLIILLYHVRKLYTARILYTYKYIFFFLQTRESQVSTMLSSKWNDCCHLHRTAANFISIYKRLYSMYYKRRLYIIIILITNTTTSTIGIFTFYRTNLSIVSPILHIFVCYVKIINITFISFIKDWYYGILYHTCVSYKH